MTETYKRAELLLLILIVWHLYGDIDIGTRVLLLLGLLIVLAGFWLRDHEMRGR